MDTDSASSDPGLFPPARLAALLAGHCDDIFALLGPHELDGSAGRVVRVFLPGAQTVSLIDRCGGEVLQAMTRVNEVGAFAALLEGDEYVHYALRVQYPLQLVDIEDPYRFAPVLSAEDLYLLGEGSLEQAYELLGANPRCIDGVDGVLFAVWAPEARRVSLVTDFNHWDGRRNVMRKHPANGVWELFLPHVKDGLNYKFELRDARGKLHLKSDPYARAMQHPPDTASRVVLDRQSSWHDQDWMARRGNKVDYSAPVSIYEVHAGSWRRHDEDNGYLSYAELVEQLIPYVLDMGFTHIQLMPVSEYPFDGSWGYQPLGLFAPTSRFGTPAEFAAFVDACHLAGIGVLLDWVPGHFPTDAHGLGRFDGTHTYEHADPRQGFHPDWNTLIYNYGRGEVISFLLSNALFWLEEFHIDGLRVDAVASMLYLDYSRNEGEWIPNRYGGRENLEAIAFLRVVNQRVSTRHPGSLMIAEESTAWPGVTNTVDRGGLGFGYKWNMGWMNDTLRYMSRDPVHRQHHHDEVTFGLLYAFSENFILPLSHDEVVHGKGSLLARMPGDSWQQFANLRAYLGFMWCHPGKKLLFMGGELAQRSEWNHDGSLNWHLLEHASHEGVQALVRDLNRAYADTPALYELDHDPTGFEWISADDRSQSVYTFLRRGRDNRSVVVVAVNMTPTVHHGYRVGVPEAGLYEALLNTDSSRYDGSNQGSSAGIRAREVSCNGRPWSIDITLPPLTTLILRLDREPDDGA